MVKNLIYGALAAGGVALAAARKFVVAFFVIAITLTSVAEYQNKYSAFSTTSNLGSIDLPAIITCAGNVTEINFVTRNGSDMGNSYYVSIYPYENPNSSLSATIQEAGSYVASISGFSYTLKRGKTCTIKVISSGAVADKYVIDISSWLGGKDVRVKFDGNGGTPSTSSKYYDAGDRYSFLPDAQRDGYEFEAWYTKSSGGYKVTSSSTVCYADDGSTTLYAHWYGESILYATVQFDPNGGVSYYSIPQIIPINVECTLRKNTFTRSGYEFIGWAESSSGVVKFSDGDSVTATVADVGKTYTLYAQWEQKEQKYYTFSFDANGGSGWMASQQLPEGVATALTENQFNRDGYTFSGWAETPQGSVVYKDGQSVAATQSKSLYAKWTQPAYTYYVSFNGNGATTGKMSVQKFTSDVTQSLSLNKYSREGWRFAGWRDGQDNQYRNGQEVVNLCETRGGTNKLDAVWVNVEEDIAIGGTNYFDTVFAASFSNVAFTANAPTYFNVVGNSTFDMIPTNAASLRVAIDPGDGYSRKNAKLTIAQQVNSNEVWMTVCTVTDLAIGETAYSFTNATYRFQVSGLSSNDVFAVSLGSKGEQVVFNPCGGAAQSGSLTYNWTVDTPYGYLPTVTNSAAYGAFSGWYDSSDLLHTVKETNLVEWVGQGTNIVYAAWHNTPYWVSFNKNGGVGDQMPDQQFFGDTAQALNPNRYYKNESRFDGWIDEAGRTFADGQVVSNLCMIAGGTNTLYAVWQSTPGANWYYVAGGMTNFGTIVVSQGSPMYFIGKGDTTQFMVTETNVAKCRVALDPQEGFSRTGAKLTIDYAVIPTNKTEELEWESACDPVSDLSEEEIACSFTTNHYYRFVISGLASTTNGYVVSIGAEGARYIFDACGGNFADEKKETTKLKFFNWTVGTPIGYLPTLTTNAYVHGNNTWHYTPQYWTSEEKIFNLTNLVVSGGEKLYAHWSDAVIVDLIFDWNLTATNVVFTNYYGQGATVKLYDDDYVRQPTYDGLGFLGWTTNKTGTAGYDLTSFVVTTNSTKNYYAQWTDEWKTSRTSDGSGLSIDGYYGTLADPLDIPRRVNTISGIEWPVNVVAIGDSAFTNCLFTSLSLPNALTSIGDSAFAGCSAFTTLDIPETVTYLGSSAFEDCTALTMVTFEEADMPDEYAESGFLDGVIDPDSPTVELGTCLFKGCRSLKDVDLPLGVNCIPDECFSGCTAMMSFDDMPYTVVTIGTEAFAGCTHLTNIVHTEIVDEIGDGAFKKCARLKFVSFLGDQPADVASDIFEKTPRNTLVRYLPNMCTTAKDYCGGTWPALPSLWPEAGNTNSSKTLTWLGGKYPRRKIIFNHNDNDVLWKSTQTVALYHEGRVFGLLAPTADEMNGGTTTSAADDDSDDDEEEEEEEEKSGFGGWYTQPMGGRKIGNYWEVPTASEGDSAPITVYAHWGEEKEAGETETGSRSSEDYPVLWPESYDELEEFSGFYTTENDETGGDDMFYYSACTFNGIVIDENNAITGTVEFAFEDATYPADGGMQSAFKATVTWNTGKKLSLSGVADAEGYVVANGGKWSLGEEGDEHCTVITKSGLNGWLTDGENKFRIYAARNRTTQTTEEGAARTVVLTGLQATKGTWHVVFEATADGEGEEYAVGYTTLSIAIANMGQATITGTLGDGTKVSTASTLIIGDGCCCLPVSIRPYGGRGGFSFMLWFTWQSNGSFGDEDASIQGLTEWDASMSEHPFTATLTPKPLTFIDDKLYTGEKDFSAASEVLATVTMKGKTWTIPTGDDNPYKLKLSYDYQTGIFTGSFVDPDDATRKAIVNGVFTDRINEDCSDTYTGYGTAVIKGEGSYPVIIGEED